MSITDELRRYVASMCGYPHGAKCSGYNKLLEIADSIDEDYVKAHEKAYNEGVYDAIDADKNAMGYVKGPVDADGVPWHLGDKVDGMVGSITYLSLGYIGWTFSLGDPYTFQCEEYRHYHEPTVEDVLREFAEKMNENMGMYVGEAIDADEWRDADRQTIAEYAAKLRLVGDDDE